MRTLIFIAFIAALVIATTGCGGRYIGPGADLDNMYTDANNDTPFEAEVRAWLTAEYSRILEQKVIINDMLDAGQITYYEHFLLMEKCDENERTIVERGKKHFQNLNYR